MELLKFIFSNFWIWFGTLILIGTILYGFAAIVEELRKK